MEQYFYDDDDLIVANSQKPWDLSDDTYFEIPINGQSKVNYLVLWFVTR